jgi:hypothetical protein
MTRQNTDAKVVELHEKKKAIKADLDGLMRRNGVRNPHTSKKAQKFIRLAAILPREAFAAAERERGRG